VEREAPPPVESDKKEISIEMSNHIKTKQKKVPQVRVLPPSTGPVQPSDPLTDWYWFKEGSTLSLYMPQKPGTEQFVYTLEQLLRSIKNNILEEGLYDASNPSIVMCSAELEEVLDRIALHVAEIRPIVMTHLIRTRLQTGHTVQVLYTSSLTGPQPGQPQGSKMTSIMTKVSISKTTLFWLKALFHKVSKTAPGANQKQTA
jgi:hypothetical protein